MLIAQTCAYVLEDMQGTDQLSGLECLRFVLYNRLD